MTSTYHVALMLVAEGEQRSVVVTVDAGCRVRELLAGLGPSASRLFRFDKALDLEATLIEAGISSGDTLGLDAPIVMGWRQLGPEVRVIGGVAAGLRRHVDAPIVIGRDDGAGLVITSRLVSRRHAELCWLGGGFTVRDLDSRHGVMVDGMRLEPGVAVRLPSGAAVGVADCVVTMVEATASSGSVPRVADPFHFFFVGGRPSPPNPPNYFKLASVPTAATRRSFAPLVVPSAGAVALAAAAGGAPTPVALAATPAAVIVALLAERSITARMARRVAHEHARQVADQERAVRDAAAAHAMAMRAAHPDPASLLDLAERRAPMLWSSTLHTFAPRVGLTSSAAAIPVDGDEADVEWLEAARTAHFVPATLDLCSGPIAIAGPEESLDALAVWLVMQAAAFVGPHELQVVVVTDEPARWAWTGWLPHGGAGCVLDASASPAALPARAGSRLIVLDRPKSPTWYHRSDDSDDWQLWRLAQLDAVPAFAATVVSATGDSSLRIESVGGRRDDVLADFASLPSSLATRFALLLAGLRSPLGAREALPARVLLSDLIPSLTSADATAREWRHRPDQLDVIIGANEAGPVHVCLTGQNSHVLVAGTTGSGKTRLLETLAVALASTHSPADLNVLVIDFKGGNELAAIARLPHCVGIVSDRDMTEVDRALSALAREIARRDQTFAAVGATDLSDYAAKSGERMPRLVVIVDEFGQFRRDDALGQRVTTLLRIAAQGRSKGLHLVLATQSPSTDVTSDIRQNVGVRMCLRVAEAAESVAVLGVPEASRLTQPGRVIVSVDNELRVAQVALSRATVTRGQSAPVIVRELIDVATQSHGEARPDDESLLDAVIAAMTEASRATGATAPTLLGPPLPDHIARRDIRGARRTWSLGGFVIGERDRPGAAEAAPLTFDPARDGALTFVGGARSGRTAALLALAEAARAQTDETRPVAVHAIDWSDGLTVLDGADCDAGVVRHGDFEHARRTVRWLAGDGVPGVTRLVLVDRLDVFLRDLRDLDGGAFAAEVLEVLQSGPRRGVYVAATIEPGALVAGPGGSLAGRRVVLSIDDPAVAVAAGLPRRASAPPGRGVVLPDGDDVQIGVAVEAPPGAPVAEGFVGPLPKLVARASLPGLDGERFALGLGGETVLQPLEVDVGRLGPVAAIVGRARSGRSSALDTIAATYVGARAVVRVSRSRPSDWTVTDGPSLVLVDDAARTAASHPWLASPELVEELEAGGHMLIAAFEQSELTTLGYGHWLMRRPCPGLLLALDATADRVIAGERLGFHPPPELRAGPAGRGWWCARGRATPVQVALN